MLGDFAAHADEFGEDAIGLIIRRELTQLKELIERSKQIYTPLGAIWHVGEKMWRFPNGARLTFAYLDNDDDADKYQGHSYCVAIGTKIRMADGTSKPIEEIAAGEMVTTLEGPRRVLAAISPYAAPCVRVLVRDDSGAVVGEQVHPIWHPVLTTSGLISSHSNPIRGMWKRLIHEFGLLYKSFSGYLLGTDQDISAWFAWSINDQIGYKEFEHGIQENVLPQQQSVPVVLHEPSCHSISKSNLDGLREPKLFGVHEERSQQNAGIFYFPHKISFWLRLGRRLLVESFQVIRGDSCLYPSNVPLCAQPEWQKVSDYQSHYDGGRDLDGEPSQFSLEISLNDTPSPIDVEAPLQIPLSDGLDTIPTHTQSVKRSWVHPYTGEERDLSELVQSGTMEFLNYEWAYVSDLSVENANHYISADTGLINKNTRVYVEELGNFPSPTPILKLMACIRSSNPAVRCGFRATGNPGGSGHSWIKQRYIMPAPRGMKVIKSKYVNPFTKEEYEQERVFIPSKITDNKYNNNPHYIARLQMVGNARLVEAWLLGNWDIVEGAYFDEWDERRHVIPQFIIPAHWTRFVSMDWGSARPSAVLWWAIVPDKFEPLAEHLPSTFNPRYAYQNNLPRGAIVCYREWYTCQIDENGESLHNNVGQKLTAEQFAGGVAERERREPRDENDRPKIAYRVADPSIFKEDGGPSLAERFAAAPYFHFWRPADNARVARKGAMGGWDLVRARLIGEDGEPMIYFFPNCVDTIRTLPALQHDKDNIEDVETENVEDHCSDSVRYSCASRPYTRPDDSPEKGRIMTVGPSNELQIKDVMGDFEKIKESKFVPYKRI